jgi:hypothetical protein
VTSRERRKLYTALDTRGGSTWWAPGAIGWWVGVLFAVGATCFALGSAPGYAGAVGNGADSLTFFTGSIFFTSAAFLQYLEAVNTRQDISLHGAGGRVVVFTWRPDDLAWSSSIIQFLGTLFFNTSTFWAMWTRFSTAVTDRLVWRPDIYGSICFLVASSLAWYEFNRRAWAFKPRSLSWWIVALNLLGSIAFGVSAVSAFIVPPEGHYLNVVLVNLGTFTGAVCFFIGAVLLLPERTKESLA